MVFTLMKILDYPYGIRLSHNGLKTSIHYLMIGVRTLFGTYFFVDILFKQIWIISNTFIIVFTNWWTFDFEKRTIQTPKDISRFNLVLCWILWVIIISVISALQRNCIDIFQSESEQQNTFDEAPEPTELKQFLDQIEI
jgi:hypothetical protein